MANVAQKNMMDQMKIGKNENAFAKTNSIQDKHSNVVFDTKMVGQWSLEKANEWYNDQPWLVGCNFIPSTAINQLEMWQVDTYDSVTIDRELSWAQKLGMNFIRVYLHDMLWEQDSRGFVRRIDNFLEIADKHNIKVMFVLLDSVHDPCPEIGKQLPPRPRTHNSRWVQSPHIELLKNPERYDELRGYIEGVISRYKNDSRVLMWDLYNEPGYSMKTHVLYGKYEPDEKLPLAQILMVKLFTWARDVNPSQPLTICVWKGNSGKKSFLDEWDKIVIENSDIITFHHYLDFKDLKKELISLKQLERPLVCTEYMARTEGSLFYTNLPIFKMYQIGACNWGLVAGKTQTQFHHNSWFEDYPEAPDPWFHDIFRSNGKPYDENETEFIKTLCENRAFGV